MVFSLLVGIAVLVQGVNALADTLPTIKTTRTFANAIATSGTDVWSDMLGSSATGDATLTLNTTDDVLVLAGVSMASTNQGNPQTATYRFGMCQQTVAENSCARYSTAFIDRYLTAQSVSALKASDRGIATLAHIFVDVGVTGDREFRLQHKDNSNNNVSSHGSLVAIRLRTTDGQNLNYGYVHSTAVSTHGTNSTDNCVANGWETIDLGANDYISVTLPLTGPSSGSIFLHASMNQVVAPGGTGNVPGKYRMRYCNFTDDACDAEADWKVLGPVTTRTASLAGKGAIAKSAMLEDQAPDTYRFELQHCEASTNGSLQTTNIAFAGIALGLSNGTKFDSFSRSGSGTTTSTTFSNAVSADITTSSSTNVFMHSTVNVEETAATPTEVVYAQFQQQLGSLMTGNPLYRYLAPDGTGSGGVFNTTNSALTGSATASLQHLTASGTRITTAGQIYGFALSTGAIINVTRAVVTDFSATPGASGGVEVSWETAAETGTAGFHLERWDDRREKYVRVTDDLQSAPLMAPFGSDYSITDLEAAGGETYHYRLVEAELAGGEKVHGPYTVRVPEEGPAGPVALHRFVSPEMTGAMHRNGGLARLPSADSIERRVKALEANRIQAPRPPDTQTTRIRISVEKPGLYRITAADVAGLLGLSESDAASGISGLDFTLSHRGEKVAYLPEQDGAGILFYAAGIDSLYTAENVYWLDWGKGTAMRPQSATPGKSWSDPVDASGLTFTHRESHEKNIYFQPLLFRDAEADIWIWDALVANSTKSYTLSTPGASGKGNAKIGARLSGGSDRSPATDHHVYVSVNGVEVGEATWDGFSEQVIESDFSGEILGGEQAVVTLTAVKDPGVDLSWVLLDGFDLEYERNYRAVNDQLVVTGNENKAVNVTGFGSGQIKVLDISDALKPVSVVDAPVTHSEVDGFSVSFLPRPGKRYLLTAAPAARPGLAATGFADLGSNPLDAEYLVISPDGLLTAAEELASYRRNRFSTAVVRLSDIYDEYNHGIADPHAIHAFLKDAYQTWAVQPKFVVLAGKGTYDPKDHARLGTDLLPVLFVAAPDGVFPSDMLYADVAGDDLIPEFAIGRLPVLSAGELSTYVAKLREYETTGDGDGWRSRALLLADNPEPTARFDNESDRVALGLPGSFELQKVYYEEGSGSLPYRESIIEELNRGALLFNYVGHGSFQMLADEQLLRLTDVRNSLLPSGGRYPVFMAFTCRVGNSSWLRVDSLAEALVLQPDSGAIVAVSPTGNSISREAHTINAAMVEVLFEEPEITIGEALNLGVSSLMLGEYSDYMMSIFGLMGDPAVQLGELQ